MISIKHQVRPYTLIPGARVPIPGSFLYAQIFPALRRVFSSSHQLLLEENLPTCGPVQRFAVFQDLHRGVLTVGSEQYTYHILPSGKIASSLKGFIAPQSLSSPWLSMGVHKQADMMLIRRRKNLQEILPILLRLSALLPNSSCYDEGRLDQKDQESLYTNHVYQLYRRTLAAIQEKRKQDIAESFLNFIYAGFSDHFLPRLYDFDYQGFFQEANLNLSEEVAFTMLQQCAALIASMFIQPFEEQVYILPALPPEFPHGRLTNFFIPQLGNLSLEWSKKVIRRVALQVTTTRQMSFHFSSSLTQCRLRQWEKKQCVYNEKISLGERVALKEGSTYLWDCFYK